MKFIPSLKGSRKGASLHVPQKRGPDRNRRPFPEPYLAYLSGSPVKAPPSRLPSQSAHRQRDDPFPEPFFNYFSEFPVNGPPRHASQRGP